MIIVNKKNADITRSDLEKMYEIYDNNLPGYVKTDMLFQSIVGDGYREQWINEVMEEPNKICSLFYDIDILVGYILVYEKDSENYVREFEIIKDYQDDGKTFREMISLMLPFTNTGKIYTGRILHYNDSARAAFTTVGAVKDKGIYCCTYDRLLDMLSMDPAEVIIQYDLKKKKMNAAKAS